MAKKRRLIQEEAVEDYTFTPKDFDEREFILKDLYGTRVLFIYIVAAIVTGVVAGLIYGLIDNKTWVALIDTLLVFVVSFGLSKVLLKAGFRVDLLEPRSIVGDIFIFLVMALGICILVINI
ncbi:MAG: hypothetical protein MJZ68_02165 [archaeon]|nr:hypothetical protein [archaeon]